MGAGHSNFGLTLHARRPSLLYLTWLIFLAKRPAAALAM